MRLISIERAKPGDILGKNVYDVYCSLLLARGIKLNQKYIEKLVSSSVECVYIDDEISKGIESEAIVPEEIQMKITKKFKDIADEIKNPKNIGVSEFCMGAIGSLVNELLDSIMASGDLLYAMTELMGTDMYTYKHSIETGILSMLIAKEIGMGEAFIKKIGMGAVLHDVGKMKIDDLIMNKKEKLTDEEWNKIKNHPRYGYDILKDSYSISSISRQIVLLHHEKIDGSGYPLGLKGDEIPIHVRIITVADTFTALISNRSYRTRKSADEALDIMRALAVYELDSSLLNAMTKVISVYPNGTIVKLTDGRIGIVIKENPTYPTRPILKEIANNKQGEVINLMAELTVFVSEIIDY